jgi:hypothetical protein
LGSQLLRKRGFDCGLCHQCKGLSEPTKQKSVFSGLTASLVDGRSSVVLPICFAAGGYRFVCQQSLLPLSGLRFADTDEPDTAACGIPDGTVFGWVSGVTGHWGNLLEKRCGFASEQQSRLLREYINQRQVGPKTAVGSVKEEQKALWLALQHSPFEMPLDR